MEKANVKWREIISDIDKLRSKIAKRCWFCQYSTERAGTFRMMACEHCPLSPGICRESEYVVGDTIFGSVMDSVKELQNAAGAILEAIKEEELKIEEAKNKKVCKCCGGTH